MYSFDDLKQKLEKTKQHFEDELRKFRVGWANPGLVEDLEVDAYGSKMKLKELASITIPEPRQILIMPWDKNILQNIESTLRAGDKFNPVVEGGAIRIIIPTLTEEKRKELAKDIGNKLEEARIAVRSHREEVWDDIQNKEKLGELSEDEKFKSKDKLQELIDEYNKKLEDIAKRKKDEVMTV